MNQGTPAGGVKVAASIGASLMRITARSAREIQPCDVAIYPDIHVPIHSTKSRRPFATLRATA